VFRFDTTLIQPTPEVVEENLRQAAAAADAGGRGRLLRWPPPSLAAFFARWQTDREGWWQWNGGEDPTPPRARSHRRSGRGHGRERRMANVLPYHFRSKDQRRKRERRSVVATVWWSDCIGRRHQRIIGCQRQAAIDPPEALLRPEPLRPAMAHIYPDHAFRLTRQGQTHALVACACGEFGTPREIGWMGDCCGPCHDRRESQERPLGPERRVLTARGAAIATLAFRADGGRLASNSLDGLLRVWDVPRGALCLELQTQGFPYCGIHFAPDGRTVAAQTGPSEITVWDVGTGMPRRLELGNEMWSLAYAPDSRLFVFCAEEVTVWDAGTGRCEAEFACSPEDLQGRLSFAGDGTPLVVRIDGVEVTFRDVLRRRERSRLRWPGPGVPRSVLAVSPDGRALVVAGQEEHDFHAWVHLWDTASGQARRVMQDYPAADNWQFSPDGRRLVAAAKFGRPLQAWDVATGAELAALEDSSKGLHCVALSPAGRLLATGSFEGEVKLWPAEVLLG
jgi:hypothetical protein